MLTVRPRFAQYDKKINEWSCQQSRPDADGRIFEKGDSFFIVKKD